MGGEEREGGGIGGFKRGTREGMERIWSCRVVHSF